METAIIISQAAGGNNPLRAMIEGKNKSTDSRLSLFCGWLDQTGSKWYSPDMAGYRDKLLSEGKAPSSVSSYMATIRGKYQRLLKSNDVRDSLFSMVGDLPLLERQAFVVEALTRLQNAVDPKAAPVQATKKQDEADNEGGLRMTKAQASALLAKPGIATLQGLRDTAMLAVLLCTGIREGELVALDVDDLRQSLGGELALRVRHGKGDKQRLIPWGDLSWCLQIIDKWLRAANITAGAVFRGLFGNGRQGQVRPGRITTRSVQSILAQYPIAIEGEVLAPRPHDCRRTYARLLFEAGVDLVAIQQNLGHSDLRTTLRYIGALDADKRRAPSIYDFDLLGLTSKKRQLTLPGVD